MSLLRQFLETGEIPERRETPLVKNHDTFYNLNFSHENKASKVAQIEWGTNTGFKEDIDLILLLEIFFPSRMNAYPGLRIGESFDELFIFNRNFSFRFMIIGIFRSKRSLIFVVTRIKSLTNLCSIRSSYFYESSYEIIV